jgi:hypothetical protein
MGQSEASGMEIEGYGFFLWDDNEILDVALRRNGFPDHPLLHIGEDADMSCCIILLYVRSETPRCIIEIGDANGSVWVGAETLREGLDICARWASLVTASALAHWPGQAADFLSEVMPTASEIEQAHAMRDHLRIRRREEAARRRWERAEGSLREARQ